MNKTNPLRTAYESLNKAQKAAVDTVEGPVMVIAGPGSGKTQILALRVANILQKTQATPGNILCLTFTESAAANMRKRLASLIGERAYRVSIHTFHSFAVEVIGRYPEFFYGGAYMTPADDLIRMEIIEGAIRDLPHGHPLRSEHPEQGYVFRKPVLKVIEFIKKAGLSPEEFANIIAANEKDIATLDPIIADSFGDRLTMKEIGKIEKALSKIEKVSKDCDLHLVNQVFWKPYALALSNSLKRAIEASKSEEKTAPLSVWKAEWTEKGDDGKRRLKDGGDRLIRMQEVGTIYARYQKELYARGFYDFDDMILDVIKSAGNYPALLSELQEMYQYILVDEFQDTNDAQMRLVRMIADAEVNEQKPNLMVVGDDDQAIYRFQGADVSHIMAFASLWKDVAVVTMAENYRSTQDILDAASSVIQRSEHRLETLLPNIEKNLVASNKSLKVGGIRHVKLPSAPHQYHFVAKEIKRRLDTGTPAEEIAVISRVHRELLELVPYLKAAHVPIKYEREQNVLDEPHIKQLTTIARYLSTVASKESEAEELLPAILAFPFWGISRIDMWDISAKAAKKREPWISVMLESKNPELKSIAEFLINTAAEAKYEPLERILDRLIGAHAPLSDADADEEMQTPQLPKDEFKSPFRNYYFSKDRFAHARAQYLSFLSSLRAFVGALREYKRGLPLSLDDLVAFVEFREKNDIPLNDVSPFSNAEHAVSLLTAHKAKGLEFETVYILSCLDSIWVGRGEPKRLSVPKNLPIEPAGDTDDDKLRLFYVALTRAKRHLELVSYGTKDDGSDASALRFLVPGEGRVTHPAFEPTLLEGASLPQTGEVLEASWLSFHTPPYLGEETALLKNLLTEYQLSVTHLNNFLDIEGGGPQKFLETNLLHFPQAKTPAAAYGTAVHEALARAVVAQKQKGKLPPEKEVLRCFEEALTRERLSKDDFRVQRERGIRALTLFYKSKRDQFKKEDLVEVDFQSQGVMIDGAHVTGKIDRITKTPDKVLIVKDYKTGRPFSSWEIGSDEEKRKLRAYARQLVFYKLLVENSRAFDGFTVESGTLEFIEPDKGSIIELPLQFNKEETTRIFKLVSEVYKMICQLRFPKIEKYSKDLHGVIEFEEDILNNRCIFI